MFNLLVKYEPWGDGRDSMPIGRMFEFTDDSLLARFKPDGNTDYEALMQLPSLFVEESKESDIQIARVGTILHTRATGQNVTLDFTYDQGIQAIPQNLLHSLSRDLDMGDFEFSRTHWAVKETDLYRALLKNSHPRRQMPKVFQITEFENIEKLLMSAMMPFDSKFARVYKSLQQVAEEVGLRCRRADDIWENPAIIQDVVSLIDRSKIVICDCTGRNPNVFYEIGIAHTLGRDVLLITQSESDIPFDLRHLRYIKYLNNAEGLRTLAATLAKSNICL